MAPGPTPSNNANATVQALGTGDTLTETFTVPASTARPRTVIVTVNGTNDMAVVSSGTGSVTEDTALTTSGTLTVTDTDAGESRLHRAALDLRFLRQLHPRCFGQLELCVGQRQRLRCRHSAPATR